jgi:hypothetical protein
MMSQHSRNISTKARLSALNPIGEMKVKPKQHPSLLLGTFTPENPPTGFSIAISPDSVPADSVVTHVATSGPSDRYKLILHVTNNSNKTVGVQVHQL